MRLHEDAWIYAASDHREWHRAGYRTLNRHSTSFRQLAQEIHLPARLREFNFAGSLAFIASQKNLGSGKILTHPTFTSWLHYGFEREHGWGTSSLGWLKHLNFVHGFAAALAVLSGTPHKFRVFLDEAGHFHFHGMTVYLDFGENNAGNTIVVHVSKTQVELKGEFGYASVKRERLLTRNLSPLEIGKGIHVRWLCPIGELMEVNDCDLLIRKPFDNAGKHGSKDWPIARLEGEESALFVSVIDKAARLIRELCPEIYEELAANIRVIVPLHAPERNFSASSTYSHLPGLIGLSPNEDPLLQAEVLIHEFCHNKLYLLMEFDSLLDPDVSREALYFSPWRKDPRHLRGILLGAHAFLNVARFLSLAVAKFKKSDDPEGKIRVKLFKLLFQVDSALRTLMGYSKFTDFGRQFAVAMQHELMRIYERAPAEVPTLVSEAKGMVQKHEEEYAIPFTGYHRQARRPLASSID